jgi:hypothetical protein
VKKIDQLMSKPVAKYSIFALSYKGSKIH